jgi:hypothetical protein
MDAIRNFFWKVREALCVHPKWAFPILSLSIGYRTVGAFTQHARDYDSSDDRQFTVRRWGARLTVGGGDEKSLYWNAALFIRVNAPFGLWIGARLGANRLFQTGIGYKLSGYLGANFRIQTDESAAAGTTGPNSGQERGWQDGPK